MRIHQLREQRKAAKAELNALVESHVAAAVGRGFSDDEKAAQASAQAKIEQLDEKIGALERQQAEDIAEAKATSRVSVTGGHDNRTDAPWASMGEMLQAVAASVTTGSADPRLFKAAASGAGTTLASDAGFLVQADYSARLMEKAVEASKLLPLCDVFEASENSDRLEAPYIDETSRAAGSRWGGVQVYRRAEADTVTAKKAKLAQFELKLEDIMGLAYISGRALEDARLIEQITARAFASEFAFRVDDEIIRGSGVGQMAGISDSTANPALVTTSIETGQTLAANPVLTKNISKMWMSMPSNLKGGSVWLYNGELGPALDELSIPSGTAALEPRFVSYGPDGVLRIKGRPAIEIEQASVPGTVGDFMLANLGEYAVLTKGGLKTDASMHVRFIYDEMAYRFIVRINGKPKWRTSLTPYKGSASRSPFIALNTRS